MSVENIPHPVSNPVRDAMSVAADDGRHTGIIPNGILSGRTICFSTDMSSLTGFFRENDLFFYRHSVPDGTHNPAIIRSSLVGGTTKQSGYFQVFPDCFTSLPMTTA
jgi:hypothetical protein